MQHKPEFFSIEVPITHSGKTYVFYESESDQHNRIYVPKTETDFKEFIDFLFSLIPYSDKWRFQRINKKIIKKYPWLFVKNRWDGGIYLLDSKTGELELDWFNSIEADWLMEQNPYLFFNMQEELKQEFIKVNPEFIYQYTIIDTKEKYNTIRWYDNGNTEQGHKIVNKYCDLFTEEFDF